ncbi:aquaporin family protein [Alicyclobacillus tolerans]|uniref:MIP/aquaporin family protein n=1 Tax=Alicyclobacillus tolerans TaxID=90970 RepID=UPI001F2E2A82|nr:MIP/aquaporin family protein [Alicyclobacillus tolerans]MCF8567533.1 aquaporin family protein [Alicyclobacillus tolerans]
MSNFLAELIGTFLLILLGDGVVAGVVLKRSKAENSGWIVITIGWGLAVMVGAYTVGHYSGAFLNPALTIGFAVAGKLAWSKVPSLILGQLVGGFLGAVAVYLHYLPHWKETDDPAAKLSVFATGPAIRNTFSNFVSEVIGTFVLVLALLAFGAKGLVFSNGLETFVVGWLIVSIGMSLGGTTGYAINPARDLSPRIAHAILPIPGKGSSDWGYAWIPVVGPIVGAIIAAFVFVGCFH